MVGNAPRGHSLGSVMRSGPGGARRRISPTEDSSTWPTGRQRFSRYVTEVWLPNHVMGLNTRQGYQQIIQKYLFEEFRSMRMNEILPDHIRDFLRRLQTHGAFNYLVHLVQHHTQFSFRFCSLWSERCPSRHRADVPVTPNPHRPVPCHERRIPREPSFDRHRRAE
ncbi:hypothetical protein [Saccharopolyspora shandongensis]|uniref:hypothetical protein n=1 Tax=Saccharopolyspora shandongensis TaxID=418495 RepID=UPI0033EEF0EB